MKLVVFGGPSGPLLLGLLVVAATRLPRDVAADSGSAREIRREHERIRERTEIRYRQAAFFSPAPGGAVDMPLSLAPLIVQQFPEDPVGIEQGFARFGAIAIQSPRVAVVRQDRPTVYYLRSPVLVDQQSVKQATFLWFYPPRSAHSVVRYRGVRITYAPDGFSSVWEVLSSQSRVRRLYVARTLERAARAAHGPPLPGRQFSVELPLQRYPNLVVPRIVSRPPQPLGPFVYLDAPELRITTLICRCEPSQVDAFPESSHYRLQPLDDLTDLHPDGPQPENLPLPGPPADLDTLLRF